MRIFILLLFTLMPLSLLAENLGNYGPVYPIVEQDLLSFIHQKLLAMEKSGEIDKLNQGFVKKSKEHIKRPQPVSGLSKATEIKSHDFDPTIIVTRDIRTEDGTIIASKGDAFNPLERVSMTDNLVFFDSDDEEQVRWVKSFMKRHKGVKLILVKGDVVETKKKLKKTIYFDQRGTICSRFSITEIPAIAYQEKMKIRVVSFPASEVTE